jgi:hypothetical protein
MAAPVPEILDESMYYWGHYWPIVLASHDEWWWVWGNRWNVWQGKPKYSEETCLSATLYTKNLSNPDRHGENPAMERPLLYVCKNKCMCLCVCVVL